MLVAQKKFNITWYSYKTLEVKSFENYVVYSQKV